MSAFRFFKPPEAQEQTSRPTAMNLPSTAPIAPIASTDLADLAAIDSINVLPLKASAQGKQDLTIKPPSSQKDGTPPIQ